MIKRSHLITSLRANRRVKSIWQGCPLEQLKDAATKAIYEGSAYHRQRGNGAASGRRYPAASKCDDGWTRDSATQALKKAISEGRVSEAWKSGFPRNVWYVDGEVVYEAVLHNEGLGAYHAYPLNNEEWPRGLMPNGS